MFTSYGFDYYENRRADPSVYRGHTIIFSSGDYGVACAPSSGYVNFRENMLFSSFPLLPLVAWKFS